MHFAQYTHTHTQEQSAAGDYPCGLAVPIMCQCGVKLHFSNWSAKGQDLTCDNVKLIFARSPPEEPW